MDPVARRYAQALYQEAEAQGQLDAVDEGVTGLKNLLDESRELRVLFESPVYSAEQKGAVVTKLFEGRMPELLTRFARLLLDKQREALFPEVVRAYRALRDEQNGIVEAHVKTAKPLGAVEMRRLELNLQKKTGKQVRIQQAVVPELIGGLVVRLGDTVYDGSVRHQLEQMRERLEAGAYAAKN
jgi:F-type H+-transporting ATPase subunit delta